MPNREKEQYLAELRELEQLIHVEIVEVESMGTPRDIAYRKRKLLQSVDLLEIKYVDDRAFDDLGKLGVE